jgi:uncharacterized protein YbbK (DUF523 family)
MQGKILGPEWETVQRRLNKMTERGVSRFLLLSKYPDCGFSVLFPQL